MSTSLPSLDEVTALVLGGGRGARMGGTPKAMLILDGQTLLERCVEVAGRFAGQVIVGLPSELVAEGRRLVGDRASVISGGDSRQETLDRVLACAERRLVVIHDVARPFASEDLWRRVMEAGARHGAAAPVLRFEVRDSIAAIDGEWLGAPLDRRNVGMIQTPYIFPTDAMRSAIQRAKAEGVEETSITTLITRVGGRIHVVDGDPANTKITYQEDWDEAVGSLGGAGT